MYVSSGNIVDYIFTQKYTLIPMSYNYFRFKWFIGQIIIANFQKSKNIRHKNLLSVCLPVAITEIYHL